MDEKDTTDERSEHPRDIADEDLPEDLRPTDNPLARDLDEDAEGVRSREELDLEGGKVPEQSESDPDHSEE